jgi:hypothetical protein
LDIEQLRHALLVSRCQGLFARQQVDVVGCETLDVGANRLQFGQQALVFECAEGGAAIKKTDMKCHGRPWTLRACARRRTAKKAEF